MPMSRGRFLTPREVADLLRVSSMTVYRLIKSGELRAVRVGKAYRILEEDVDAYLAGRFTQAGYRSRPRPPPPMGSVCDRH
jgi:excisionase family DNA binding protein